MASTPYRILLVVSGMTPQVITETLYGLHQQTPAWIPDEVRVLTTTTGKTRIVQTLFNGQSGGEGWYYRWLEDYAIKKPVVFDAHTIEVIKTTQGRALDDLRTPQENEAAADYISHAIRAITSDPNTELHVSIAGGRKTMGFYAGYALSLFARPGDRLSHVLVDEPFERLPDFYYPSPVRRLINDGNGGLIDAASARVWLASIPFVPLRGFVDQRDGVLNKACFSELIALVTQAMCPVTVHLKCAQRSIYIDQRRCILAPREFGFYLWFAKRAKQQESPLAMPHELEPRQDYAQELAAAHKQAGTELTGSVSEGLTKAYFEQCKSRLSTRLRKEFGPQMAAVIGVATLGERGRSRYGLTLQPHQIVIER